jgi:hypothetical protein
MIKYEDKNNPLCTINTYAGGGNECTIIFGKREGKRPLDKSGRRWEDSIKMLAI